MKRIALAAIALVGVALLAALGWPGQPSAPGPEPTPRQPSTPSQPTTPSSEPTPRERVRVIVEVDSMEEVDGIVALVAGRATKLRRTETMPYLIMEIPLEMLAELRAHPHVRAVTIDRADPPN